MGERAKGRQWMVCGAWAGAGQPQAKDLEFSLLVTGYRKDGGGDVPGVGYAHFGG